VLEGHDWGFEELVAMADRAEPFGPLVDPDDPTLSGPGDMPRRIRAFCARTGQSLPETPGELVRCVLESVVLGHRHALELLVESGGARPREIHLVGGGARNRLLCQWTADATGLPVLAGPEEATAIGNLIVQAIALGEIASLDEARELVRASFETTLYEPGGRSGWDEASARFETLGSSGTRSPERAAVS
jgi:rhamnulokinase